MGCDRAKRARHGRGLCYAASWSLGVSAVLGTPTDPFLRRLPHEPRWGGLRHLGCCPRWKVCVSVSAGALPSLHLGSPHTSTRPPRSSGSPYTKTSMSYVEMKFILWRIACNRNGSRPQQNLCSRLLTTGTPQSSIRG